MINLDDDKKYFILVDGQGATFGGGRIFEGIKEMFELFKEYADMDGYDDPKLIGWSLSYCLENWTFGLKEYNGTDFVEVKDNKILDYKIIQ